MTPQQFEEQTQSLYRFRSARSKRRSVLEDRDKQLRKLSRERDILNLEQRNQPWEPLDPPYQRGWKRSFVLRDDVARSEAAPFYERILSRINTVELSNRPDFKRKKRRQGRRKYVERVQHLQTISVWKWREIGFDAKSAALFELQEYRIDRRTDWHYVFSEPWRFRLRVEKNMINRFRKPLTLLESRLQQISNRFHAYHLQPRHDKIMHGFSWRYRWKDSKAQIRKDRRAFRETPIHRLLATTHESGTSITNPLRCCSQ